MIRTEKKTVFPLLSGEMGVRAWHNDNFAAQLLRTSCELVHSQSANACCILRVVGGVDSSTSEELLAKIELLLGADRLSRLILDLEGVGHMDSSGVGALLAGWRDSQDHHVRFTLCGLRKSLHDMLRRTRLASLFEIQPTVEEALCS